MVAPEERDAFGDALNTLLDAGVPFRDAFEAALRVAWRGADEPVQVAPGASVRCVCGTVFRFKPGAVRARCPGCGCRYERQQDAEQNQIA